MAITDWPIDERPREKLLRHGPQQLSDAELLAIFLRTGCAGKSAVDLARDLLNQFSGLRALLEADKESFCSARGLGDAKFTQLQAVLEMARRHLSETLTRDNAFTQAEQVRLFLTAKLRHKQREVFCALFLNNQHHLLAFEELFQGTINSAQVHPREVVKRALSHNAAAIILAHNHPSGDTTPSQADKLITQELKTVLDAMDIRLLDHFVVGEGEIVSFAEQGLL